MEDNNLQIIKNKFGKVSTIRDVFKTENNLSIAKIKKDKTERVALLTISAFIADLNDKINVKVKMNRVQIDDTSESILAKYFYLTVPDMIVIFDRIKDGEYGNLYESMDRSKIMRAFKLYSEERADVAESIETKETNALRLEAPKKDEDFANKMIAEMLSKCTKKFKTYSPDGIKRERTAFELFMIVMDSVVYIRGITPEKISKSLDIKQSTADMLFNYCSSIKIQETENGAKIIWYEKYFGDLTRKQLNLIIKNEF